MKVIMIVGEESWGHPWSSPKKVKVVKMVKKTKMAKIHFIKGKSGNGVEMTRLLGKSGKYVLIDKLKEITNINEGSWGHPWGSPKRVKIANMAKMAKIHFFKGKIRKKEW